jgi:hypothetical protein
MTITMRILNTVPVQRIQVVLIVNLTVGASVDFCGIHRQKQAADDTSSMVLALIACIPVLP